MVFGYKLMEEEGMKLFLMVSWGVYFFVGYLRERFGWGSE